MNGANNNVYLYSAYIVVWFIHLAYALTLVSRSKRMKRELRELKRSSPL
jgi:CcmD family protein